MTNEGTLERSSCTRPSSACLVVLSGRPACSSKGKRPKRRTDGKNVGVDNSKYGGMGFWNMGVWFSNV